MNPWMGCMKVSQGCRFCYAEALTETRMKIDVFGPNTAKRRRTGEKTWANPMKWNRLAQMSGVPARVFCASLADVFEDARELMPWRRDLWNLIRATPYLDWQLLTKRPENIARMLPDDWDTLDWATASNPSALQLQMGASSEAAGGYWPHVWLGTSIENNEVAHRAAELAAVPAINHFVSYEPAIGPGDEIPLDGISWVIQGGESGSNFRPMDLAWAFEMWARCSAAGVAYFFKQSAAYRTESGIDALGEIVREYPCSWDRAELRRAA